MAASDYVVMALPHTPATDKLIGPDALAALRPQAVLVNIGRGKTLDEDALVEGMMPHHPERQCHKTRAFVGKKQCLHWLLTVSKGVLSISMLPCC